MPRPANPLRPDAHPSAERQRLQHLAEENSQLRAQLEEAEETLRAIRSGEVDAVIVAGPKGEQVFTLKGEDLPYRALVEAMNEGAATFSSQGLLTYCNSRFPPLFGLAEENIVGKLLQEFMPAAHRAAIQDLFQRAVKGQPSEGEFRFDVESGNPRVIRVSLSRVNEEDVPAVCMVATDFTQHQGEVMLRLAQKAARCGSWQWNPLTGECVWSTEYWDIFGLKVGSCRPSYENFLNAIHPDDRGQVDVNLKRQLPEGHFTVEFRTRSPDDTVHWILGVGTVVAPDSVIGLNMDITDRKQTEQALIRSEKLASVGRMAATVAHEINNPLSAVMNSLFLLQASAGLTASDRDYLRIIDGELKRIAHITQQSLGFYRDRSGPTTFAVNALLDSVLDVLRAKMQGKNITIIKECDPELQMTGIFGELRQVFANLVTNAIDAVQNGGSIQLRAFVTSEAGDGGEMIVTSVRDDGQGVAPNSLEHIFEPFFTTKEQTGTGLGLWISKQIVEKHMGSIEVHSSTQGPTRGTTVYVRLPQSKTACQPAQPAA